MPAFVSAGRPALALTSFVVRMHPQDRHTETRIRQALEQSSASTRAQFLRAIDGSAEDVTGLSELADAAIKSRDRTIACLRQRLQRSRAAAEGVPDAPDRVAVTANELANERVRPGLASDGALIATLARCWHAAYVRRFFCNACFSGHATLRAGPGPGTRQSCSSGMRVKHRRLWSLHADAAPLRVQVESSRSLAAWLTRQTQGTRPITRDRQVHHWMDRQDAPVLCHTWFCSPEH